MNNRLVVSTHLKNISQIGNLSHIVVKIKNIWNQHLVSYTMNNHSFDHPTSHKSPLDMEVGVARPVTCCCNTSRSHGGRICHLVQGRIVVVVPVISSTTLSPFLGEGWMKAIQNSLFFARDRPYSKLISLVPTEFLLSLLHLQMGPFKLTKNCDHYHSSSSENSAFL